MGFTKGFIYRNSDIDQELGKISKFTYVCHPGGNKRILVLRDFHDSHMDEQIHLEWWEYKSDDEIIIRFYDVVEAPQSTKTRRENYIKELENGVCTDIYIFKNEGNGFFEFLGNDWSFAGRDIQGNQVGARFVRKK